MTHPIPLCELCGEVAEDSAITHDGSSFHKCSRTDLRRRSSDAAAFNRRMMLAQTLAAKARIRVGGAESAGRLASLAVRWYREVVS